MGAFTQRRMNFMKFRKLYAGEIDARIQQITSGGRAIVLLYKDARCDMRLLDETVGALHWQRSHEVIGGRLYCTVSVYDADASQWVSKSDVGTESTAEHEKGQASDSFKRACFNWGIGRELYTAPTIFIQLKKSEIKTNKAGKPASYVRFKVSSIDYDGDGNISHLVIKDEAGDVRFRWSKNTFDKTPTYLTDLVKLIRTQGLSVADVKSLVKHAGASDFDSLTEEQAKEIQKEIQAGISKE